jgi:ATP-binding cassette, subfamily F, member 3
LLHTLRGTLPLLGGSRHENEMLRLGMFTQDLAQELDPSERAVDVVTAYARHGPDGDVTVSSEQARSALGRLGLTGEKSLRFIRDLSGGEKARVCLAMFALKPSNLYLLDEASNHLDVECVECLSSALGEWGGAGAFVVVSHDRHFCEQLTFTHVATVQDGLLTMEERDATESDWNVQGMSTGSVSAEEGGGNHAISQPASSSTTTTSSPALTAMDEKTRKQAFNAPKRIAKIETQVASLEDKIAAIEGEMLSHGSDVGKLVDLTKAKEALEAQVARLMEEWGELEALLARLSA